MRCRNSRHDGVRQRSPSQRAREDASGWVASLWSWVHGVITMEQPIGSKPLDAATCSCNGPDDSWGTSQAPPKNGCGQRLLGRCFARSTSISEAREVPSLRVVQLPAFVCGFAVGRSMSSEMATSLVISHLRLRDPDVRTECLDQVVDLPHARAGHVGLQSPPRTTPDPSGGDARAARGRTTRCATW